MSKKSSRELRRGERFTDAQYAPFAITIGQLVLTWNDFHEKLAMLFTAILSNDERKRIPKKHRREFEFRELERLAGIWSSSPYDRPKRAMLRGLMTPLIIDDFIAFDSFADDIIWILDWADKIEEIRNNAVHAPLLHTLNEFDVSPLSPSSSVRRKYKFFRGGTIGPNIVMKNRRAIKLANSDADKELLREFRWARDAAAVLRDFSLKIVWALIYEPAQWPRRPSLPNRGQKKKRQNLLRLAHPKS